RGIAYPSLALVDMDAEVRRLLSAAGWDRIGGISEPTYSDLLLEFLCTLHFDRTRFSLSRPHMVSFRLCGHQFNFSVSDVVVACGFYTDDEIEPPEYAESLITLPDTVDPRAVWTSLTINAPPYEPTVSKSTYLRSPALRYLHRFSVYSISGWRESTGVVTHRDLFCLWSLTEGRASNLAYLFLTHMEQMSHKKRGAICGGTYITRLAWRLDIFRPDPQVPATCLQLPIDMTIMTRMGLVQRVAGGEYALTQPLVPPAAPQGEDPQ